MQPSSKSALFIASLVCSLAAGTVARSAVPMHAHESVQRHRVTIHASPEPTEAPGLHYRAIGPAVSGGRVAAVAGSDRDPHLYYAGAAGGGVWKSSDGGLTWEDVWKSQPLAAIGALAIDPHDPRDVWAGTGESNPRNDVSWGDGMWRTRDGGKHWTHLALDDTSQIAKISIDPNDASDVVVAALGNPYVDSHARGMYRTRDGGKHWTQTLYLDGRTGGADLARDPKDPRVLYASLWSYRRHPWELISGGDANDGLYKSSDGGSSWHRVAGGFPAQPIGRIGVAIAPSKPSRVYAVVQSKAGTIWRSDDAGATWSRVSSDTMPEQRPFYFSHLAVDPHDANAVIAVSMYLTVSKDGGRTWKHLVSNIHVDNHALWWSADGKRLINGNDGGVAISNDGGDSWTMPLNLPIGQVYHVAVDAHDPYEICGGWQDNSAWCGYSDTRNGIGQINRDWISVAGGDGMFAIPSPLDSNRIWADTENGPLGIYDRTTQQDVDVNPWVGDQYHSSAGVAENPYRFNWNAPLAFSPEDPHTVYYGANVVFATSDDGQTWKPISPDLTRDEKAHQGVSGGPVTLDDSGAEEYDTLLAIAPSRADAMTIWAGSDDGLVHLTRDGGTTWKNVTPRALPAYARIETIEPSASDAMTAYVAADRHEMGDRQPYLFVTHDAGATWQRIDGGLPRTEPAHVIRMDPKNASMLYAGTESGVWYTRDLGRTWLPLQFNLPRAPVYDLQIQPVRDDLIVATHGLSLWVLDDLAPLQEASAMGMGTYLLPLRAGTMWASWQPVETGDDASMENAEYVGSNPSGPALITFWQPQPAKTRPSIEIVNAAGKVVRHLSGSYDTLHGKKYWVTNAAGYNRLAWDGLEDGPTRWHETTVPNMGPLTGAEALPGTYTVRLIADGKTFAQPFELKADPRSSWTAEQRAARHDYIAHVLGEISAIDDELNLIDAKEKPLRSRHDAASVREMAALDAARDQLTANDRNDEDGVSKYDRLRERVFGLAGAVSGSFQPPFAAETSEETKVDAIFEHTMSAVKAAVAGT